MRLYPTRPAVHLALAGAAAVGVGLVSGHAAVVAWGAAVVVGVAVARAATLVSVARIRAAGFEMLWSTSERTARVSRGGEVVISAEVRNRDTLAARYVGLRTVASSQLDVKIEPSEGEVPASGKLRVTVTVKGARVGRHGLFGLALEVRGAPGLFEVPLTFANPFGIEVMPAAYRTALATGRGGRARRAAEGGRAGRTRGEGSDLREVREHQSGDPFKRIAWRASARRGKLMVREMEHEERDVVWIVLDASAELWSGAPGTAPLDLAIDDAAALAGQHLSHGDSVGLIVVASHVLATIEPAKGPAHGSKLFEALAHATSTYDHERTDLAEADVALRVVEHLRPLDPNGLADVSRRDLDRLMARAEAARARAPFRPELPIAPSMRERRLRQYLWAFGVECPARGEPEAPRTIETIAASMLDLARRRPRPSIVYAVGPAPVGPNARLEDALRHLHRAGTEVRWVLARYEQALAAVDDGRHEAGVLVRAVMTRRRAEIDRSTRLLRRLGVKVQRMRELRPVRLVEAAE
jgi:uncharacterized protein (DUF58 family)